MMAYQHSPRALTSGFQKPSKELYNSWGGKNQVILPINCRALDILKPPYEGMMMIRDK
jgi:hypothetical protein